VNRRTQSELKRILTLVNDNHSESKRARGKIKALLDENKRAAAEEVKELEKLFEGKLTKIRSEAAEDSLSAAKDLTAATKKLYAELASVQLKAAYENDLSAKKIAAYESEAATAIQMAEDDFNTQLNQLANVITANADNVEKGFEVLTGVVHDFKTESEEDRRLLKLQMLSLDDDMGKRIIKAIQEGETRAKNVANRARVNLRGMKKSMLIEISERVEATADKLFESIQKNHHQLADNYLSLKAYAVTASDKLTEYVTKGKGKNLSSLGDLLSTMANKAHLEVPNAEGLGFGLPTIPGHIFNFKPTAVEPSLTKINGLVNEYTQTTNAVRKRWPMGLGKYLLAKLEDSMLKKGVLQVDKIHAHNGNYVFMNGHAVGLSNKLNDFETLAVRMAHYEATLAKLTAGLSGKIKVPVPSGGEPKPIYVPPPEWKGT